MSLVASLLSWPLIFSPRACISLPTPLSHTHVLTT
jgi:hypothetical protein